MRYTDSVVSELCMYLAKLLKPLTGMKLSHTDNSLSFVQEIKLVELVDDDIPHVTRQTIDILDCITVVRVRSPVLHKVNMPLYGILSPVGSSTPSIKIEKKSFSVGRDPSCDVVLKAPGVLSVHGFFTVNHNNELFVKRSSEQSRVAVGGQEVTCAARIKLGDEVQLGDAKFTFNRNAELEFTQNSVTSAQSPFSFRKPIEAKALNFHSANEVLADQSRICDNEGLTQTFQSVEGHSESDFAGSPTVEFENSRRFANCDATPFETPRGQSGIYFPASQGTIFETPCYKDVSMEATPINSTCSDSERDSVANNGSQLSWDNETTIISNFSTVFSPTMSNNATSAASLSAADHSNSTVGNLETPVTETGACEESIDVDFHLSTSGIIYAETTLTLPIVMKSFATLSLSEVEVFFTRRTDTLEVHRSVPLYDMQFGSLSVGKRKSALAVETRGNEGLANVSKKMNPPKRGSSLADVSSPLLSLVPPKRGRRPKKQDMDSPSPTGQPSSSPPIASRTRSHTTCQPERKPSGEDKAALKRATRSADLSKRKTAARDSRTASTGERNRGKASAMRKGSKGLRLHATEDEFASNPGKKRGRKK
uniref:FHA domain-containing protein n=1 Tax=Trichuris muris TaxID=70415 RepID=A0A5S6QIK6_TRIMR